MIESYRVGAVLEIDDRASGQIEKMARLAAALNEKLTLVQANFDKLGLGGVVSKIEAQWNEIGKISDAGAERVLKAMTGMGAGTSEAFASMVKGAAGSFDEIATASGASKAAIVEAMGGAASGSIEALRTVGASAPGLFEPLIGAARASATEVEAIMARVAGSAEGAAAKIRAAGMASAVEQGRLPTAGGGVGRASHARGGPHFGRVGTEIPGGHASISGGPAVAAAGIIGYGAFEAAEMRDEVNRLMVTGQVDAEKWGQTREQLSKFLMDSASLTTFSVKEVGEALSKSERAMSGLDVATKMSVTRELMPYAASEARLKETSLAESLESMVGMAHMTGTYDPEKIRDLARKFSYVSLSTNASLPKFENTLSYSMPILRSALGMDPETIMALTAVSQNAGITSTKSGTWLRSFFEGSEPETGDGEHAKKHNEALRSMGLLDDKNMPTWKVTGADGKTNWNASVAKEAGLIGSHLDALPVDQRIGTVKGIWGERGGGMASMLSMNTFVEQFATLAEKIQKFQGGSSAIEELAKDNPLMKGREAWRDFQNVLIDIGNTTLPTVNLALTNLDIALKRLPDDWDATKKMWGDRIDAVEHLFTGGPLAGQAPESFAVKAWRTQHPGQPVPADLEKYVGISPNQAAHMPHADGTREGTDRSYHKLSPDETMKYMQGLFPGLSPIVDKTTQGMDQLGGKTGVVSISFDTLDKRAVSLNDNFTGLGTGSGTLDNAFKILEFTAMGAARALATVAMSGGAGGGAGGLVNASYGGGGRDNGSPIVGGAGTVDKSLPKEARALLDTISSGEAHGYNVMNGGGTFGDLSHHPGGRAAGRYQDLPSTWRRVSGALGLHDFSPASQDKGNWWLAQQDYHAHTGRDLLGDLQSRDPGRVAAIGRALHSTWVSTNGSFARKFDHFMGAQGSAPVAGAPPSRTVAPGKSAASAGQQAMSVTLHNHTHLDGKVVAENVSHHQALAMEHPNAVGGPDTYGSWQGPATPLNDAA